MPRRKHDVFISHASEDKDAFVRPLAEELRGRGLDVWYDEFSLGVGDSLRRSIDQGLVNSRFGIVVISPSFIAKQWPQYELDGLLAKQMAGQQKVILPVWHEVTHAEVLRFSPSLAGVFAARSSDGLSRVADQISAEIPPRPPRSRRVTTKVFPPTEFLVIHDESGHPELVPIGGPETPLALREEKRERQIVDLHVTSLDRDEATIEWRTSATVELHVSVFRAGSRTPEHAIQGQSLSMVQQAFTFHDLKPGANYLVVAESGDGRRRVGFKTLEEWMR